MSLKHVIAATVAVLTLSAISPTTAFARAKSPFAAKVCEDTKWCIGTPSCYETESNRQALINWYIDNC